MNFPGPLILLQVSSDVIYFDLTGAHAYACVPCVWKLVAREVSIGVPQGVIGVCGLRQCLIGDAVQLLPDPNMVVPLEENADLVGRHELMDWRWPSRSQRCEVVLSILARASPLP
ncbi:MAG: hypothetical protein RL295_1569 [Pseudomonadota bacterium]